MTARYTFVVCSRCGVVSPPTVIDDEQLYAPLIASVRHRQISGGWRIESTRFNSTATCPACIDAETTEKDSDSAA
jgi:hypothetical protein